MKQKVLQTESRILDLVGSDLDEFKYDELPKAVKEEVKKPSP